MARLFKCLFCSILLLSLLVIQITNSSSSEVNAESGNSCMPSGPRAVLARLNPIEDSFYGVYRGVILVGDYAYVASRESKDLFVFDISQVSYTGSEPPDIYPISSLELDYWGNTCITRKGNFLYIGGSNILHIVDISIPSQPTLVNSFPFDSRKSIKVINNYLITVGNPFGRIWDLSDPEEPVPSGSFGGSHNIDATISGDYLYVAEWLSYPPRITIYDISNIDNPTYVDFVPISFDPYHIDVVDDFLYVASEHYDDSSGYVGDIYSFSLSDSEIPELTSSIELDFQPRAFGINEGFAVAASTTGVLIDISSPDNLGVFGTFEGSGGTGDGFPYDISIDGDKFLVAGQDYALLVSKGVITPEQAVDEIKEKIPALPGGSEASLTNQLDRALAKLEDARNFLTDGELNNARNRYCQAIGKIEDFITIVEAKVPSQIDPDTGNELVHAAEVLIALIEGEIACAGLAPCDS